LKLELLLDQIVHHPLIETMLEQGALRVVCPVITVAIAAFHYAARTCPIDTSLLWAMLVVS
jgi:hypothetical protein